MQNRRTLLSVAGTVALATAIALMPKVVRADNQVQGKLIYAVGHLMLGVF